jgi:glutathione peroxidase
MRNLSVSIRGVPFRGVGIFAAALVLPSVGCAKSREPARTDSPERTAESPQGTSNPMNAQSNTTAYAFTLDTIDGESRSLAEYKGKVLLIVNVASKCGFTPQYEGLQELHERYGDQGLAVLGVPSNDFMGQEPGTNEEIKTFCESNYHVTFPLFSKVKVKGSEKHPLYGWLTKEKGKVSWNFNKFLIGRDGRVLDKFGSMTKPLSDEMVGAITSALAQKP